MVRKRAGFVVCHWWLRKEPVVMHGNLNVRQATSQQVFKVTRLLYGDTVGWQHARTDGLEYMYFTAQKLHCVAIAMCWCTVLLSCWKTNTSPAMMWTVSSSSCITDTSQ